MFWRGALLFCLGCSFDPAGLEGRPAPCLDGYAEIDGFCFLIVDAGRDGDAAAEDAGTRDVPVQDANVLVDGSVLDGGPDVEGCRCTGADRIIGCDPCAGEEHLFCLDGEVMTGSSCANERSVATCIDGTEVVGDCRAGCGEANGWGCDFVPELLSEGDSVGPVLQGRVLTIDTSEGTVRLDGVLTDEGILREVDDNMVLYVSAIDVETVSVTGTRGVGIRASDTIRIRQGVDVAATGPNPGPGGAAMQPFEDTPCGEAGPGGGNGGGGASGSLADGFGGGGGGGGGFGTPGGNGGTSGGMGCPGYNQGGEPQEPSFVGGSAGGGSPRAAGGGGGGAVYLSARVAIIVSGLIDASGGGGGGGSNASGAGGGSGGLIYLEAPILSTTGLELRANGGGGGGGGTTGSEDGEDGRDALFAADGGDGDLEGGAGSDRDGDAEPGQSRIVRESGGGGGGAGWIIFRTGDGNPVDDIQTRPDEESASVQWERIL